MRWIAGLMLLSMLGCGSGPPESCVPPSAICGHPGGLECVDLRSHERHCGSCDHACPGGQLCYGGSCACPVALPDSCTGASGVSCVSLQADTSNCGICGHACAGGESCAAGVCKQGACGPSIGSGPYELNLASAGGGTVSDLVSLDCTGSCTRDLDPGARVALHAFPDASSVFRGWSGDCTGTGECVLKMDAARCVGATFDACPGAWLWSLRLGGAGTDRATAVATDSSGNIFLAGYFSGSAAFGGPSFTSAGGYDIFLSKLSPTGAHLWSRRLGGAGRDEASAVAVDAHGDVIVAGRFEGASNLGGAVLTSAGHFDAFVAKYSGADGAHLWSRQFGDSYNDGAFAVAVNAAGDIAVAGRFYGAVSFGSQTLSSAGFYDAFVAKLSGADGSPLWARRAGGPGYDSAQGVAFDPAGDVVVAGDFVPGGAVDVGGLALSGAVGSGNAVGIFVAKLAGVDGAPVWAKAHGSQSKSRARGVAVNSAGEIIVAGELTARTDLGSGVLVVTSTAAGFVQAYSSAGAGLWGRAWEGSSTATAWGVAVAPGDDLVVSGNFVGAADFGGGVVRGSEGDGFVVRLARDGSFKWVERVAGGRAEMVDEERQFSYDAFFRQPIAIDRAGNALIAVTTEADAWTCAGLLPPLGGEDALLFKLGPSLVPPAASAALLPPPLPKPPLPSGHCVAPAPPPKPLPAVRGVPIFHELPWAAPALVGGNAIAAGDFNGDGFDDVFVSGGDKLGSEHAAFYVNDGTGLLSEGTAQILGGATVELDGASNGGGLAFDANGDGKVDLFIAQQGADLWPFLGGQSSLLLQSGGGLRDATFPSLPIANNFMERVVKADVDCNGSLDLFPPLLLNDGKGVFTQAPPEYLTLPWGPSAFALCDVNNDGAPDLILGDGGPRERAQGLMMNDRTGRLRSVPDSSVPPKHFAHSFTSRIVCADFNLDGFIDVAVLEVDVASPNPVQPTYVSIWLNNGNGTFRDASATVIPQSGNGANQLVVADVNNDGWPDLIASGNGCNGQASPSEAQIFINQGGTFVEHLELVPTDTGCSTIYPFNADNDGRTDLLRIKTGKPSSVMLNRSP